jgi:hypothetical protein
MLIPAPCKHIGRHGQGERVLVTTGDPRDAEAFVPADRQREGCHQALPYNRSVTHDHNLREVVARQTCLLLGEKVLVVQH